MGAKILIVEDDKNLSEAIRTDLERKGFEVYTTGEGRQALTIFRREQPHVMVLDYELADKFHGDQVLEQLRREGYKTPIIFLSGVKVEIEDKIFALDSGADDYLTKKSFDLRELIARLQAVLRRSGVIPDELQSATRLVSEINIYNETYRLIIDRDSQRAWINEEEKQISAQEFNILSYMMRRSTGLVRREELQTKVFGIEPANLERRDDYVRMSELRKKLAVDDVERWIINEPKRGYRFHRKVRSE